VTSATAEPHAEQVLDAQESRRRRLVTWFVGLDLVVLHVVVTLLVRPAPRWNDGIFVLNDAASYPDLSRAEIDHHVLRIGTIFPTRLFLELFGYGQVGYYAWPFLTGILLIAATYALGTLLFGRWAGAAATVLLIFHPVFVDTVIRHGSERMTSWQLLPDIPSTAFFTLGLVLLVAGAKRDRDASAWWFIGAGLAFGEAYLIRELTAFVFPVIPLVLLMWRAPLRRWLQVAGAMLACLVFELVHNAAVHGDAFIRLKVGSEHGSPIADLSRMDALLRFPRAVEAYPQTIAVLTTFALTVLGALLLRRRGNWLVFAWFTSMWLPLSLASGLLDPGYIRINASLMRYWVPVMPSLCLGAAGAVAGVLAFVRRRSPLSESAGQALTAAVAVVGLLAWCVPMLDNIARNDRDSRWNALRAYLAEHDAEVDRIVASDRDSLILGIYAREPIGGDRVFEADVERTGHELPRREVEGLGLDAGEYLLWTPTMTRKPPRAADTGWRLVFRERELRLYAPA
jgi:hypothetical protein